MDFEEASNVYDEIAYHRKETAKMPFTFSQMTVDQQLFFCDLFSAAILNVESRKELLDDLNLIKSDLEAVIASVKK